MKKLNVWPELKNGVTTWIVSETVLGTNNERVLATFKSKVDAEFCATSPLSPLNRDEKKSV